MVAHPTIHFIKCFVMAILSVDGSFLPCFYDKYRPPLHLAQRPLKHNVEKETWKLFCGKTSHHLFLVIQVILRLRPLGCAGEHTLHYLDGQSLRNPCVWPSREAQI